MQPSKPPKKSHHAHRLSLDNNQHYEKADAADGDTNNPRYPVGDLHLIEEEEISPKELRILEFLVNEGVEFRSPWDKIYDYYEKERRKLSEESTKSSISMSEIGKTKFSLNSSLYKQRISKTHEKSHSQSPRPSLQSN